MAVNIDYDIAYSGSSGNAVQIGNLLFDIGVSYKKIKDLVAKVDAILISHEHPDHLSIPTYNAIRLDYPFMKIFGPMNVWLKLKRHHCDVSNFIVTHDREQIYIKGTTIKIYVAKHEKGVQTNTYEVYLPNLISFVFGTDFYDFNDLPQGKYDACFIEANHDANYKQYVADKDYNGHIDEIPSWLIHSTGRHTTKQQALEYYVKHRISQNSIFEPLHKSSRFYDLDFEK